MLVLANGWSDEARLASLAVRRAKSEERREARARAAFYERSPGASEADWEADVERRRVARMSAADRRRDKWMSENPSASEDDWFAEVARRDAYRRERARDAAIRKAWEEFREENPDATFIDWEVESALRDARWRDEQDKERWFAENPEGTEEGYLRAKIESDSLYKEENDRREQGQWDDQKDMSRRRRDEPFVKHWVSRGADGAAVPSWLDEETGQLIELPRDAWPDHLRESDLRQGQIIDPHWGPWASNAPYGYTDDTGEIRTEPLYDEDGYPIVPVFRQRVSSTPGGTYWRIVDQAGADALNEADERFRRALEDFGRWGEKKKLRGMPKKYQDQYVDGMRSVRESMSPENRLAELEKSLEDYIRAGGGGSGGAGGRAPRPGKDEAEVVEGEVPWWGKWKRGWD